MIASDEEKERVKQKRWCSPALAMYKESAEMVPASTSVPREYPNRPLSLQLMLYD